MTNQGPRPGETPFDPRYPVGRFDQADATPLDEVVSVIRQLPAQLRAEVAGLTPRQLAASYREGGWTARQVVHHLADAHLNSVVRFRTALTEEKPAVREWNEKKWAELSDAREGPIEASLLLLEGLHARWAAMLASLTPDEWKRTFIHPKRGEMSVEATARLYAWHCRHHLAHVVLAAERGARVG